MAGSVRGAPELIAALQKGAEQVTQLMTTVVEKSAADLKSLIQVNASGRPGPNAPTGDYRASWRVDPVETTPDTVSRAVGTDRPQANRLEFGFTGIDSAGRHYDQPPYPHMGPAVDVIGPNFQAAMDQVAERAVAW